MIVRSKARHAFSPHFNCSSRKCSSSLPLHSANLLRSSHSSTASSISEATDEIEISNLLTQPKSSQRAPRQPLQELEASASSVTYNEEGEVDKPRKPPQEPPYQTIAAYAAELEVAEKVNVTQVPGDLQLFTREMLEIFWGEQYTPSDPKWSVGFFNTPRFYVSRPTMTFYIGTDELEGKQSVMISSKDIPLVLKELQQHLKRNKRPPGNFTIPTVPLESVGKIKGLTISNNQQATAVAQYLKANKAQELRNLAARQRAAVRRSAGKMIEDGKSVFVAIDVEVHELCPSKVLEVGWTIYDQYGFPDPNANHRTFKRGEGQIPLILLNDRSLRSRHFCNSEHEGVRNGRYVADRKKMFDFGTTEWATLEQISKALKDDIRNIQFPVLVGHNLAADIMFLKDAGINFNGTLQTMDTQTIDMAKREVAEPTKLSKLCDSLGIANRFLHNAGNDARYTLEAFICMAREAAKLPER